MSEAAMELPLPPFLTILENVRNEGEGTDPMTTEATLTSKGQTTIPIEIRESLQMKTGDRMTFTLLPDGTVLMRVKNKSAMNGINGWLDARAVNDWTIGSANGFAWWRAAVSSATAARIIFESAARAVCRSGSLTIGTPIACSSAISDAISSLTTRTSTAEWLGINSTKP